METGPDREHDVETGSPRSPERDVPPDAAVERPRTARAARADDLPPEVALDADLDAIEARARRLQGAGITTGAVAAYRELVAARPREHAWRRELATILAADGRAELALAELDRGLDLAPDEVSLLAARAALLTGLLRYERAEADLRRAVRVQEHNVDALIGLGSIACKRGRWREGLEPLRRATDLAPDNAAAWYHLGDVYHHLDQLPPALAAYQRSAELDPTSHRALKQVGNVLDRMNRPREAAAAHRRALAAQRRVSRRALIGGAVLVAWVVGLALLVQREFFRPADERLALAGLRVAPGASYYRLERDGRTIGWASSTVDTTAGEIVIEDRLVSERDAASRTDVRASVTLSRALLPHRFQLRVADSTLPLVVTGRARGDSAIELSVSAGGAAAEPQLVPTRGRVYPATAVPLLVALGEQRRVGGRIAVTLFDPTAMAARDAVLRVTAESLFTVSDSAAFDDAAQRWVSAHTDTVRAWFVRAEGDAGALAGWVDAQGRMVEATYPGGYVLRRTSYEESAENWRRGLGVDSAGAATSARTQPAAALPPTG